MNITNKLVTTVVAGVAAFAISKAVTAGWELITGEAAPSEEDSDDMLRLAIFAGISAAAVAIAQHYALTGANRFLSSHQHG